MTDSCADYGGDAAFGAAAIDGAGASDVDEDGTADSGSGCDDGAGASVLTMVVVCLSWLGEVVVEIPRRKICHDGGLGMLAPMRGNTLKLPHSGPTA